MINEERVKEMTHMAVFEQKEGMKARPMEEYFRSDYIGKELIKSLISGTIAFAIMMVIGIVYKWEEFANSLQVVNIEQMLTKAVFMYLIFMFLYLTVTYIVYDYRYREGRKKVRQFYQRLKKVNQTYRNEDRM
ncbi:MAG: hypothetical protein ACK5ML_07640 [Lachnospiraceae bacterium]